jgi:hypothetical protein
MNTNFYFKSRKSKWLKGEVRSVSRLCVKSDTQQFFILHFITPVKNAIKHHFPSVYKHELTDTLHIQTCCLILKLLSLHSSALISRKCCNFDKHHFYCTAGTWFIPQTELQMWTVSLYILCTFLGSHQELSPEGQRQCANIRCRSEQHIFPRYLC